MSSPVEDRFVTVESQRLKAVRARISAVEGAPEELQSDLSNTTLADIAGLVAGGVTMPVQTLYGWLLGKGLSLGGGALGSKHTDLLDFIGNIVGGGLGDPEIQGQIFDKLFGEKPEEIVRELTTVLPPEKVKQLGQKVAEIAADKTIDPHEAQIAVKQQVIKTLSEVAKPEEKWESGYMHGTPTGEILPNENGAIHVTEDENVANRYAHRKQPIPGQEEAPNPTVHNMEVRPGKVLDLRDPKDQEAYEEARQIYNQTVPEDKQLPPLNDIVRKSGLPDYGHIKELHQAMPEYDSIVTDEGHKRESLSVFDGNRIRHEQPKLSPRETAVTHPERILPERKPPTAEPATTPESPITSITEESKPPTVTRQTVTETKTPRQRAEEEISTQTSQAQLHEYAEEARQRRRQIQRTIENSLNARGKKETAQKLTAMQRAYEASGSIYSAEVHGLLLNPKIPVKKLLADIINIPAQTVFKSIGVASERHSLSAGAKTFTSALYAYRTTFKNALQLAFRSYKSGEPEFLKSLGIVGKEATYAAESAYDTSPIAYKYRMVKAIGDSYSAGSRMVMSADQFAKALTYNGELRMNAFIDGLNVAESRNYVGAAKYHLADIWSESLYADSPEWLHAKAMEGMYETTFTKQGPIIKWLEQGKNKVPGLRNFVPFLRTPANLLRAGIEMTPLNISWMWKSGLDQSTAMAKWMVGSSMYYELAEQTMQGNITGDGPSGPAREFWAGKSHPRCIRVGGKWISYNNLGPFAVPIALAADSVEMYHASKDPDSDTRALDAVGELFANQIIHAPFVGEMYNLFNVLDSWKRGESGKAAEEFLTRTATMFEPAILREAAQIEDPYTKRAQGLVQMMAENVPGWSKTVRPNLNIFGYAIPYAGALDTKGNVSKTDMLINTINPFPVYPDTPLDDVDNELYHHGFAARGIPQVFSQSKDPSVPPVPLTDQQWTDWAAYTGHGVMPGGKNLHDTWQDLIHSDGYKQAPPTLQTEMLENVYSSFYSWGQNMMVNKQVRTPDGKIIQPNIDLPKQKAIQKQKELGVYQDTTSVTGEQNQ